MQTISIEILNPKAKKLLKDMADLNLITIKPQVELKDILKKLRNNDRIVPSLEEITQEVETVRKSRHAKK